MILTKKQIIIEILKGVCTDITSKFYIRVLLKSLSTPDNLLFLWY